MANDRRIPADPTRFNEAMRAFRMREPMAEQDWLELDEAQRARAFKVAWVAHADIAEDIAAGIDRAIRDGTSIEDFRHEMVEVLDDWAMPSSSHLETIFRTNLSLAYNAGRREIQDRPAVREARPYLRHNTIDDGRADDECLEIDGLVLPADDPFWETHRSPLHFNCRCNESALSKEEAEDEGIADEAPEVWTEDGFGREYDPEEWEPDTGGYSDAIGGILAARLR